MKVLLQIAIFTCFHTLIAQVDIKNGNFHVSFTDASFQDSGGAIDQLTRTYNSKSTEIGWFGYGWGTKLESTLYMYPDYAVLLKEHGAGGKTLFKSTFQDEQLAIDMIELIIDLQLENNLLDNNPSSIAELRKQLGDPDNRYQYYDKLVDKELVDPIMEVPEGIVWQSFDRGDQQLTYANNLFLRTSRSGLKESFNLDGQLIKMEDKNGNFTEVFYENGFPKRIKNKNGYSINITTNEDGLITSLKTSAKNDEDATYKYVNQNLIYSRGTRFYQYKYEYDALHNMTATIYNPVRFVGEDEDKRVIEYWPKSSFTKRIIERDSVIKNYSYQYYIDQNGARDDLHYSTTVNTNYPDDKNDETVTYEYFIGIKADGSQYTQKIITTTNGITSSSIYDEACSYQPIRIEEGDLWTTFVYDRNCNMIEKEKSTGEYLKLKHHPTLKKMIEVQQDDNLFVYDYDDKANLIYARKNDEDAMYLTYDEDGHMDTMTNGDKTLTFEYNSKGKPIKIMMKDIGMVNVIYKSNGAIERVESPDGHRMALQITMAFQNLIAVTKPANLDYNL
ncbi:hypothetical protein AAU57_08420 [Nonlabens sp. YIK11]|uniref:DUF6531 domain-containing protein n=1 Tax=Nonlabens sp. YIK11 TaxID=1453349 RepID=UPI0007082ACE|nr:DUF6531 domain-containing protein [Nonlabens sp. YIK11]KQC33335.1 hypothetical protein AAU57_08420 [Nonlabens sp. YIK11]